MNISRINTIKTTFTQNADFYRETSEKTADAKRRTRIGFLKKDKPETEATDTFEQKGPTLKEIQLRNKIDRIKAEQKAKGASFKGTIENATSDVEFEYVFKKQEVEVNEDNADTIMTSFKPIKTFYSLQQMPKEFLLKQISGANNLSYFEMSEDKPFGKTIKITHNKQNNTADIVESKLSLFKKEKQIGKESISLRRINFNEFVCNVIEQAETIGKAKIKTEVPLVFQ